MEIKKVRIKNFKSFYDEVELDFKDIKGFWKISGSVGSGKTTIGEAIIYGLFGGVNGKNNGDLISWGQKSGCVEIWCESKQNDIYIKRDMKLHGQSPVYVEVNGEELLFTNKRNAQQQLETEYYDTSRMVLELLCIISFNNFKSLASLNTTDTKKFLDQVLGFYVLTEYSDICKQLRKKNQDKANSINNDINTHKYQINKLNELSNQTFIEGNIEDIKHDLINYRALLEYESSQYKYNNDKIISEQHKYEKEIGTVLQMGKTKAKEIEFIKKGICPMCGAKIDDSNLNNIIEEKRVLGEQYKHLQTLISECQNKYTDIYNRYTEKSNEYNTLIENGEKLIARLEEQSKRTNINTKEIDNIEHEILDLNAELSDLTAEDAQWTELYNILSNDVRSQILASFIPALNENIQKYVRLLQLPYIIQFDSMFKCNIEIYGLSNKIPITSLSTGQLKVVDMVIILGILGTVLGSNGINIIFLDELFSNLDSDLRDDMCNVLKYTMPKNKTIFIISHQDINSQVFDGNIDLKLESQGSFEKKTKMCINKV